jgi:hypothetical protein
MICPFYALPQSDTATTGIQSSFLSRFLKRLNRSLALRDRSLTSLARSSVCSFMMRASSANPSASARIVLMVLSSDFMLGLPGGGLLGFAINRLLLDRALPTCVDVTRGVPCVHAADDVVDAA